MSITFWLRYVGGRYNNRVLIYYYASYIFSLSSFESDIGTLPYYQPCWQWLLPCLSILFATTMTDILSARKLWRWDSYEWKRNSHSIMTTSPYLSSSSTKRNTIQYSCTCEIHSHDQVNFSAIWFPWNGTRPLRSNYFKCKITTTRYLYGFRHVRTLSCTQFRSTNPLRWSQ